jgi:hypothetical protein
VFSINVDVSPCRNTKGFDYEARSRRMSAPTWPSIFRERSIAPMTTGVGLRVAGASTRNSVPARAARLFDSLPHERNGRSPARRRGLRIFELVSRHRHVDPFLVHSGPIRERTALDVQVEVRSAE